jgi:hypothetical protein
MLAFARARIAAVCAENPGSCCAWGPIDPLFGGGAALKLGGVAWTGSGWNCWWKKLDVSGLDAPVVKDGSRGALVPLASPGCGKDIVSCLRRGRRVYHAVVDMKLVEGVLDG